MNRNIPHAWATGSGTESCARSTKGQSVGSLLAVVVLITTTVAATLFATGRGNDDDARRIERICVANGGYWVRTGAGGACIDISETAQ